jgi:dienelactone hydrolase
MKNLLAALLFFSGIISSYSQDLVTFTASDGLTVSANLYEVDESFPYLILYHQAGYSKGEYKVSAIKLLKLGYNCLAVDLRSGGGVNFVQNETANLAKQKGISTTYLDAEKDMIAAIDYAYEKSNKQVVLFGSSYSASLAMRIAKGNSKVKAVIAFSPGEYFQPDMVMKEQLKGFDKPVFVACSQREFTYMNDLLADIPAELKTVFKPQEGIGEHGSKSLWQECPTSKEYWLALLMYFKKLENIK